MVQSALNPGDLPAVTVVDITEPTAIQAGIEILKLEAIPLQSVPLRARRVVVRLGDAAIAYQSTNVRIRTHTSLAPGLVCFSTFGPHAKGTVDGLPVQCGMMLSANPGTAATLIVEAGYESVATLVCESYFREHLADRQRDISFKLPPGIETLKGDPDHACALFDWGKRLADIAARQPALFNDSERMRAAARVDLLDLLFAALADTHEFESTREDRTHQSYGLLVKKAEDYVLSRPGDHVSLSDLCRVTAASERTLQYAFTKTVGLTPHAYLTRIRLHRVRESLLAGSQATTTVSEAALHWGFWHFGEFSRAYRDCFDELPSDTLRRKQD